MMSTIGFIAHVTIGVIIMYATVSGFLRWINRMLVQRDE